MAAPTGRNGQRSDLWRTAPAMRLKNMAFERDLVVMYYKYSADSPIKARSVEL